MTRIQRRNRRGRRLLAATGLGLIAAGCGGTDLGPRGVVPQACDAGLADGGCIVLPGVVLNPDGGVDGGPDGG